MVKVKGLREQVEHKETYTGIPIFRKTEGNENWFKKITGVTEIRGKMTGFD